MPFLILTYFGNTDKFVSIQLKYSKCRLQITPVDNSRILSPTQFNSFSFLLINFKELMEWPFTILQESIQRCQNLIFSVKCMQVKYITSSSLHSTVDKPSNGYGCVIGIAIVNFLSLCNGREVAPAFA